MNEYCEICKSPAHGHHFGAVSCRACAAFFRRAILAKRIRQSCKFSNTCTDFRGIFHPPCKSCRMEKCVKAGMRPDNLQEKKSTVLLQTVEIALSRPTMVLISKISSNQRTFVDVNHLVKHGLEILTRGAPAPLEPCLSQLERMSIGGSMSTSNGACEKLTFVDKNSAMQFWESDFLSAAKWLTHFDEFTMLPKGMQMQLLQVTWHIWARLHKIIATSKLCQGKWEEMRVFQLCDKYYVHMEDTKADVSWMANCSYEQVRRLMFGDDWDDTIRRGMDMVYKLNLTEIEVTYMVAQLCFEYAASRFQGKEMAEICEKFQAVLANDIHRYYTSDVHRDKNYAGRLCQILKINKEVQREIRHIRDKTHVARTFDILIVDFSHPEMFIDTGVK